MTRLVLALACLSRWQADGFSGLVPSGLEGKARDVKAARPGPHKDKSPEMMQPAHSSEPGGRLAQKPVAARFRHELATQAHQASSLMWISSTDPHPLDVHQHFKLTPCA